MLRIARTPSFLYLLSSNHSLLVDLIAMDGLVAVVAEEREDERERQRLTAEQRWTCIVLYKHGWTRAAIARLIPCRWHTVAAVLARWRRTADVHSGSRGGRQRCTDFDTDVTIAVTARIDRFPSPRQVKRKLNLDVSPRTVDRRLQEAELFGRVARHKRDYSDAELRKRLSFANGYKD